MSLKRIFETVEIVKPKAVPDKKRHTRHGSRIFREVNDIKEKSHQTIQSILSFWLFRSRRCKRIRQEVAGLLEKMTSVKCDYCGQNFGLRCELIDSIEVLFYGYLKEGKETIENYNLKGWQEYFMKRAHLRTLCHYCIEEVYANEG